MSMPKYVYALSILLLKSYLNIKIYRSCKRNMDLKGYLSKEWSYSLQQYLSYLIPCRKHTKVSCLSWLQESMTL